MYGFKLATAPVEEPITLTEAKAHLRVTDSNDDTYITDLIPAVRRWAEEVLNRALVTQTWDLYLDAFPTDVGKIVLPRAPLASVSYIKYYDESDELVTLEPDQYEVDDKQEPARIQPAYNVWAWPTTRYAKLNAVNVRFEAGYGAAEAVPNDLKHALKVLLAHFYEQRAATITGTIIAKVPLGMEMLLLPHTVTVFP